MPTFGLAKQQPYLTGKSLIINVVTRMQKTKSGTNFLHQSVYSCMVQHFGNTKTLVPAIEWGRQIVCKQKHMENRSSNKNKALMC